MRVVIVCGLNNFRKSRSRYDRVARYTCVSANESFIYFKRTRYSFE